MKFKILKAQHNSTWPSSPAVAATAIAMIAMVSTSWAQIAPAPAAARATVANAVTETDAFGTVSRATAEGKTLHVTVGHSIFVNTKSRLRRVYVADPTVLNSVTLTPTEIIVTAMNAGISSLTLLDEAGQAQSYVVSADLDIDGLRAAMSQAMRGDSVKVEGSGARITLTGTVATDALADAAVKLAGLYCKEVSSALNVVPSHPRQVRLEVRILEVDRSKALQEGINLFNPGGNSSFLAQSTSSQFPSTMTYSSSGSGNVGGGTVTTSNPLNFMLYSAKLNLGVTIEDLQSKQVLQILAEPTITTVSGKKADFLSGGEFPFPMVQSGGTNTAPVVSIQFRPYGVKVEFTPFVNEDGTIRLLVSPEVSALDYSNSVTISGFTVPALSTRRATTEVELRSNQSFAISGLLDQRTTDIMSKNPGAANIPILGALFKSKSVNHATTELIVVVTPTIVDPLTETTEPAQPEMPIKPLDTGSFDKSLGKNLNPQPAAPPLNPPKPPMGNYVPTPVVPGAPVSAPATGAAQQATPKQTPQAPPPPALPKPMNAASQDGSNTGSTSIAVSNAKPSPDANTQAESMVEIMAVSHESDAEAMVAALNRRGYNVAVTHNAPDSLIHLDVGPFSSSQDAESMRQRLVLDGYNATIR